MMKIVALFVVLCGISAGYANPVPNAFMYYQQPIGYISSRQVMYGNQYQNQQLRTQRRLAGVLAGNNYAAGPGMYLKDCQITDVENGDYPAQDPNVQSVAEAYPDQQYPLEDAPQDGQFPLEDAYQNDAPSVYDVDAGVPLAGEPVAAAAAPAFNDAVPDKKKKKPTAQLDSDEDYEHDTQVIPRVASRTATPSVYFPVNFGSTSGSAIAISNSYSTGNEGSAASSATAYGTPSSTELRRAARVQLKRRPSKLRAEHY